MLAEIEVGTRMYALNFLETERHTELDVGSGIGIVSQFLVVMEAIVLISHAKCLMPRQTVAFPILKPLHFGARLTEELHLHLLKFTHTEDELAGNYLVAEGLSYLTYTER